MTDAQYKRIQWRIRREMKGRFDSSGWFASAVGFLSVGATIVVTVEATSIAEAANKGKLETAAWACGLITLICLVVHFVKRADAGGRADDIIEEMDTYNIEVAQHQAQHPASGGAVAASPRA